MTIIQLPTPNLEDSKSIEKCISIRESVRDFKNNEIELEKLSKLLWSGQGKKGFKRTIPSAGATYPLELFVILKRKGIFHYDMQSHSLKMTLEGDFEEKLAEASWRQYFISEAPLNIVICAEFARTSKRYGERGVRYVFIEVGHCAQNIHLQAVALGLGSVPIGAFDDKKVKKILNIPDHLEPLYIIPIGYPR